MAHERHHVEEVADLGARAVLCGAGEDLESELRKLALQAAHGPERRVVRIVDAADDLQGGAALLAERAQPLVQARLGAAQRFEYRGRRRRRRAR